MKTVLITGASGGIGRATAIKFGSAGYTVGIGCRNIGAGKETADAVKNTGGQAVLFTADLRDGRQIADAADEFRKSVGIPDILVCCAGVAYQNLFQLTSEEDYNRIMDSNVRSAYLITKEFLGDMINRKSGSIVYVSSMWGEVGGSCEVIYSASKAALIGMTKALAKEVGPSGIRVNCVSPGVIITAMTENLEAETLNDLAEDTPLGRNGLPSDVAESIFWLASDASSFITGQVLGVNGGTVI